MDKVCLLMALCLPCLSGQSLESIPSSSVSKHPQETLSLSCRGSGFTFGSYGMHWIRQAEGKALEWLGLIYYDASKTNYASSVQGRIEITRDNSKSLVFLTLSNLKPEDSAVYYCASDGGGYAFDYWGKGTMVTVTSATSTAPTVFPVMPCGSGTGDTVTLACLATGFSPSAVSFAWSLNDKTLDNSIQYPPVLKDNLYSGVSQLQVTRQEWEARKTFKCKVDHAAGSREVNLIKPNVVYIRPSLEILTSEDDKKVTFSCLANDFTPKVYAFKWLKDNVEITDKLSEITTPSKDRTTENGTLYTAASFLTLSSENMQDDTQLMCIFNLGRGDNVQSVNVTHTYRPPDKPCPVFEVNVQMDIIPPSVEHMLLYRKGKLVCTVNVKTNPQNVKKFFWSDENDTELVNSTRSNNNNKGKGQNGWFTLPLDITFDEWNSGITRICEMHHDDLPYPLKKTYQRQKEHLKRPSVFMLPPLKLTDEKMVTLTCYAKDFSPQEIFVSWQIDAAPTTFKFSTTNSIQSNGSYYAYSQMTIPLNEWENPNKEYSCRIYHESIDQDSAMVKSITYHSSEQINMVNLNMNFPSMCKAQ